MIRNEALYDFLKKYVEAGCIKESQRSLLSQVVQRDTTLVRFDYDRDYDYAMFLEFTSIGSGFTNLLSIMKWPWSCWSVTDSIFGSKIIVHLIFK